MNPFSHYDLEKPEFEQELRETIAIIEKLKEVKPDKLKKVTIDQLKKETEKLKQDLLEKDKLIRVFGAKLKV